MSTAPDDHPAAPPGPQRRSGQTGRPSRRANRPPVDEEARRERLEAFHTQLSQHVVSLTSSTAWTDWLRTAARFHNYSFRNTVAIWAQRPDATQVAGYRVWQAMGRQVRKGERGIEILAPVTRRVEDDQPDHPGPTDHAAASGGAGRQARAGDAAPAAPSPHKVVGYRIAHVFDISQTEPIPGGPPLPTPPPAPQLLTGQAPAGLWDGLARQVAEAGFTLTMTDPGGGARGRTNHTTRQVEVDPELEPAQQAKTVAHEMGHVLLHHPADVTVMDLHKPNSRARFEVEAESVAFLVTVSHGMDPGGYSFPYVAGWATETPDVEATLRDTGSRVLQAAHRILDRLDRDNPAPLPVAEDSVHFEVPSAHRATSVPAAFTDQGRHRIPSPGRPEAARTQHGVSR